MLGNNPKSKYQSHGFKTELAKAKTYKRGFSPIPENKFVKFLQQHKLLTWKVRVGLFILLCLVFYIFFFPNFLKIKSLEISGLNRSTTEEISAKIYTYLNKGFLVKQYNLLLFSKKGLNDFLTKQSEIISVTEINKNFPNKLIIKIKPRVEKYILLCDVENRIYSNDGKPLNLIASSTNSTHLIQLSPKPTCPETNYFLDTRYLILFENVSTGIFDATKTKVSSFEFSPKTDPDVKTILENGSYLLFDSNTYSSELLNNLKTLYNNLNPEERKKIYYIDLRITNKAFVCFKGNSCTQQTIINPVIPQNNSTSTLNSTLQ